MKKGVGRLPMNHDRRRYDDQGDGDDDDDHGEGDDDDEVAR